MSQLTLDQLTGDYAKDLTASGQRRIRHGAHQTDLRAAIHQTDACLGQRRTQLLGGFKVYRLIAGT
ncbi:MAG: hypothetical protein ACJATR_002904 [Halopseudomonas sp.]|jgi:hypothetical protein